VERLPRGHLQTVRIIAAGVVTRTRRAKIRAQDLDVGPGAIRAFPDMGTTAVIAGVSAPVVLRPT